MSKTTVKRDRYSLYIRANGTVYRPVPSKWTYPHPKAVHPNNSYGSSGLKETRFKESDEVKVGAVSQSPFARVKSDAGEEFWHSHGSYIGAASRQIASEDVWAPDDRTKDADASAAAIAGIRARRILRPSSLAVDGSHSEGH